MAIMTEDAFGTDTKTITTEDAFGTTKKSLPRKLFEGTVESGKEALQTAGQMIRHPVSSAIGIGKGVVEPFAEATKYGPVAGIARGLGSMSGGGKFDPTLETSPRDMAATGLGVAAPFLGPGMLAAYSARGALKEGKPLTGPIEHPSQSVLGSAIQGYVGQKGLEYVSPRVAGAVKKAVTPKLPETLASEASDIYRSTLRPTQSELKNIEVRKGQNIDDLYRLAAEEKLPIEKMKIEGQQRMDTGKARQIISDRSDTLHETLNKQLDSDPRPRFDLEDIGKKVKADLKEKWESGQLSDADYSKSLEDVTEYTDRAIQLRGGSMTGRYVTGRQLNDFKKGMWKEGYNQNRPTAQKSARQLGRIAKETIEQGYPDTNIKKMNELSGKYQTLNTLLENAHGRVIQRGQLGRYAAQGIGAVGLSKIPVVGPLIGAKVGGMVSDFMSSPERASARAIKKVGKAGIEGKQFGDVMAGAKAKPVELPPEPKVEAPKPEPIDPYRISDKVLFKYQSKGVRSVSNMDAGDVSALHKSYKEITKDNISLDAFKKLDLVTIEQAIRKEKLASQNSERGMLGND